MVLDMLKGFSDDFVYDEGHILFLLKKYRAFLIKKEQDKEKSSTDVASEFEYQQICLDLEKVAAIDGEPCTGGYYLRSTKPIPKILEGTQPRVYPIDYFQGTYISYISRDRMRYVGSNPYLSNILYVALGPDLHLYLNSGNPQFLYLQKIRMSAVFEDFDAVSDLLCDAEGDDTSCDVLEAEFPIREYLVPPLLEMVVKVLTGSTILREDKVNNAKDDMGEVGVKS